MTQCCGECKWWTPCYATQPDSDGYCWFPCPISVIEEDFVESTDGANCPCFQKKPTPTTPPESLSYTGA